MCMEGFTVMPSLHGQMLLRMTGSSSPSGRLRWDKQSPAGCEMAW